MEEGALEVRISWNDKIAVIVLSGHASKSEMAKVADQIVDLIIEDKPQGLLADYRNLDGRLGVVDIYNLIQKYRLRHFTPPRIAILDRPAKEGYFKFHQMVAANVGVYPIRFFTDLDAAMSWLQS